MPALAQLQSQNSALSAWQSPGGELRQNPERFPSAAYPRDASNEARKGHAFCSRINTQLFKQPVKIPNESGGVCWWESAVCHFEILLPEQWDFNSPPHLMPAGGMAVPIVSSPGSSAGKTPGTHHGASSISSQLSRAGKCGHGRAELRDLTA